MAVELKRCINFHDFRMLELLESCFRMLEISLLKLIYPGFEDHVNPGSSKTKTIYIYIHVYIYIYIYTSAKCINIYI